MLKLWCVINAYTVPENVKGSLSSAEASSGYPNKNGNNGKIESARGTRGRGKRREPLPYNAFKMARDFRGRLEQGRIDTDVYKMAKARLKRRVLPCRTQLIELNSTLARQ